MISGHVVRTGAEGTYIEFEGGGATQSFGGPKGESVIALTWIVEIQMCYIRLYEVVWNWTH